MRLIVILEELGDNEEGLRDNEQTLIVIDEALRDNEERLIVIDQRLSDNDEGVIVISEQRRAISERSIDSA